MRTLRTLLILLMFLLGWCKQTVNTAMCILHVTCVFLCTFSVCWSGWYWTMGQVRLTSGSQVLWSILCWAWMILSGRGFREHSGSEVIWRCTPGDRTWSVPLPLWQHHVCMYLPVYVCSRCAMMLSCTSCCVCAAVKLCVVSSLSPAENSIDTDQKVINQYTNKNDSLSNISWKETCFSLDWTLFLMLNKSWRFVHVMSVINLNLHENAFIQ